MSQQFQEKSYAATSTDESNFTIEIDVSTLDTATMESQTQVISLGHPEKESLKDFDKDMEVIVQDSLEHWD